MVSLDQNPELFIGPKFSEFAPIISFVPALSVVLIESLTFEKRKIWPKYIMSEVSTCTVSLARKIAKISDLLRPATGPDLRFS